MEFFIMPENYPELYNYKLATHVSKEKIPLGVLYRTTHSRCEFHDHNFSEIVLILQGSATHCFEGQRLTVRAGDVLLLHPENIHAYDDFKDMILVNVIYDSQKLYLPVVDGYRLPMYRTFVPENIRHVKCCAEPIMHLEGENMKKVSELIKRMHDELKNDLPGGQLCSIALLIELIITLCRFYKESERPHEIPQQIGEILNYMKKNYNKDIKIDALAKKVNMSRRNFFLVFKKITGLTPIQYLIRLRIANASEKLLNTDKSIADIAYECGFADSNYFCRKFHEINKFSPRNFRISMRCKNKIS